MAVSGRKPKVATRDQALTEVAINHDLIGRRTEDVPLPGKPRRLIIDFTWPTNGNEPWSEFERYARIQIRGKSSLDGPVAIAAVFSMKRSPANAKDEWHIVRPSVASLGRELTSRLALAGVCSEDSIQVLKVSKAFPGPSSGARKEPGLWVAIAQIGPP